MFPRLARVLLTKLYVPVDADRQARRLSFVRGTNVAKKKCEKYRNEADC